LDVEAHNCAEPLAAAGLLDSSVAGTGSSQQQQQQQQQQHQQQHQHQQERVAPQCQSLSELLQQAGMPQLTGVSMSGWQRRSSHASKKSSSSSSNAGGRRRHGALSVPLLSMKADDSTMLATL
jgi:hypothetical protein